MHGVFTAGYNNNQNLMKLGAHLVNESIKTTDSIVNKIKSGFLSLLKSVSNSFKCLVKLFSFSKGSNHFNHDQKSNIHFESVPSVAIEEKYTKIYEDNVSRTSRQAEFHKLKTEMHAQLGAMFKQRAHA